MNTNYFQQLRLDWIEEMLRVYGYINRSHIVRKFEISEEHAGRDLSAYHKINPDSVEYDRYLKAYVSPDATVRMIVERQAA